MPQLQDLLVLHHFCHDGAELVIVAPDAGREIENEILNLLVNHHAAVLKLLDVAEITPDILKALVLLLTNFNIKFQPLPIHLFLYVINVISRVDTTLSDALVVVFHEIAQLHAFLLQVKHFRGEFDFTVQHVLSLRLYILLLQVFYLDPADFIFEFFNLIVG